MPAYREDRRIEPVRRLGHVTRNEAAEESDLQRDQRYEREREAIADDRRSAAGSRKVTFAERLAEVKKGR